LQAWEEKHGRIPDDVILLVFSNWARFWPDRKAVMGTDTANASLLHFPGKVLRDTCYMLLAFVEKLISSTFQGVDFDVSLIQIVIN